LHRQPSRGGIDNGKIDVGTPIDSFEKTLPHIFPE